MTQSVLSCRDIVKSYSEGPKAITVLNNVQLDVKPAQHVAIVGASGSGKSTLLNILGGLDKPDSGEVLIHEKAFSSLSENKRGEIRNASMGFVYQFHHLLPEFSALENVEMPLLIARKSKKISKEKAMSLLEQVGLSERCSHKPAELSGGERQRVAIARALANDPSCVLMDEPTGNLDAKNAAAIQALMKNLSHSLSTSFVVVTHDERFAKSMDSVYELQGGVLLRSAN